MTAAKTTFKRVLDSEALPPLYPDQIRLQCGGAGWMGTFAKMARLLAEDLLDDGEPFEATIVIRAEMRADNHLDLPDDKVVIRGRVSAWLHSAILFEDGTYVVLADEDTLVAVTI